MPPLAIPNVPPRVNDPKVSTGPPLNVKPVVPPEAATEVTVPVPAADDSKSEASDEKSESVEKKVAKKSTVTKKVAPKKKVAVKKTAVKKAVVKKAPTKKSISGGRRLDPYRDWLLQVQ